MNDKYILVFDFETAGVISSKSGILDASKVKPIQVACLLLHPRTLEVVPGSEFNSMMRAEPPFNEEALRVNKKKESEILPAPEPKVVWKRFGEHVRKYNPKGNGRFTRPIPSGKNIRNFDMPILQWLCEQYGLTDKDGTQNIVCNRQMLDFEDDLLRWWEDSEELPKSNMDTVRPFFGLSNDLAHDALADVKATALLIQRHLRLYRNLRDHVPFKNGLAGKTL